MRVGAEYFSQPSEPAQRRYEALRAYFVDGLAATEVAARFGYTPAVVHQMASDLRAGRAAFFRDSKPGPKDVMSSPSDPTCRDLLSSSAERVRAGLVTVELEEAPE